jgi:mRNA interferase YafQ
MTMLEVNQLNSFERDLKRIKKRGKPLHKLQEIIELLAHQHPLPARQRDHMLTGNWQGTRECHIEPDWLLIYKVVESTLTLIRTGSHSDLFD